VNKDNLPRLVGTRMISKWLGVTNPATSNWVKRELEGMPEPSALMVTAPIKAKGTTLTTPLWEEGTKPEWLQWYRDRNKGVDLFTASEIVDALEKADIGWANADKVIKSLTGGEE
jgi:hypothetical protein